MTHLPGIRSVVCAILLSFAPVPAFAQNRTSDVSVGTSLLTEVHTGGTLLGVTSSFTTTGNRGVGITGEGTASLGAFWFLGGPRLSTSRGFRWWTAYAHLLAGPVQAEGGPYFVVEPGAGVDLWIRRGLGVRVQADYQQLFADEPFHGFRMLGGIVVAPGRRH